MRAAAVRAAAAGARPRRPGRDVLLDAEADDRPPVAPARPRRPGDDRPLRARAREVQGRREPARRPRARGRRRAVDRREPDVPRRAQRSASTSGRWPRRRDAGGRCAPSPTTRSSRRSSGRSRTTARSRRCPRCCPATDTVSGCSAGRSPAPSSPPTRPRSRATAACFDELLGRPVAYAKVFADPDELARARTARTRPSSTRLGTSHSALRVPAVLAVLRGRPHARRRGDRGPRASTRCAGRSGSRPMRRFGAALATFHSLPVAVGLPRFTRLDAGPPGAGRRASSAAPGPTSPSPRRASRTRSRAPRPAAGETVVPARRRAPQERRSSRAGAIALIDLDQVGDRARPPPTSAACSPALRYQRARRRRGRARRARPARAARRLRVRRATLPARADARLARRRRPALRARAARREPRPRPTGSSTSAPSSPTRAPCCAGRRAR